MQYVYDAEQRMQEIMEAPKLFVVEKSKLQSLSEVVGTHVVLDYKWIIRDVAKPSTFGGCRHVLTNIS
jgi:hypothetical protein